jgi:hypothetical protein
MFLLGFHFDYMGENAQAASEIIGMNWGYTKYPNKSKFYWLQVTTIYVYIYPIRHMLHIM